MAEGRGRARGYLPPRVAEPPQSEQPGTRRAFDIGHSTSGHDSGNGNGDRPSGGRTSHRGGMQRDAPGESARPSRRLPRGRRAIQEDEAMVIYTGDPAQKHVRYTEEQKRQHVTLYANYVRFARPRLMIYQYRVEFSPEFDNRRGRGDIIRLLLPEKPIRYDGRELLFSTAPLCDGDAPMHFTAPHPSNSENLEVTITQTNRFGSTDPQTIQFLNVSFGNDMRTIGMKRIQRHHFFVTEDHARRVQGRDAHLDVLPGFSTAYSERDAGLLLNVDMVSKVLRCETVAQTMRSAFERSSNQDEAGRYVIGQVVYARYSNQTYRIEDVDWEQTPRSTFDKGGVQISYCDYFKKRWNITITDLQQPLLIAKPRRVPGQRAQPGASERVNLIPELVYLTGLTEEMRRDFTLTRSMAQTTNVAPDARYKRITALFGDMSTSREVQNGWKRLGLQFDTDLITIKAAVIPNEVIVFGGEKKVHYESPENPDWSKMRDTKMVVGARLERWIVLYPSRLENETRQFVETFQRVARSLGMDVRDPTPEAIANDAPAMFSNTLNRLLQNRTGNSSYQLVMCVLTSSKKDSYDTIKKACCLITPVPSQVLLARTITDPKKVMSVATKVAIQVNAKLGGEPWTLDFKSLKAMIVGVDVYHDTTKREHSHVAMVSSINHNFTRYHSQTQAQIAGQEQAMSMETMMVNAINAYRSVNKEPPKRIFYYRDGVSDGQLGSIVNDEMEQINCAFRRINMDGYDPIKFYAVVVKKRINTRLLLKNGGIRNPLPGTVVDTEITMPNWCDFYLVSQSVRQGTVAPTHYNIVRNPDPELFTPDRMQKITYKLAHMYFNWNGTIRVPAPCQYAHKLAFITGESLHQPAHSALSDKLWFL